MFLFPILLACGRGDPPCASEHAWVDVDGDGFGDPVGGGDVCEGTLGYVANGDDCDDHRAGAYPGAEETCNGVDDDCDGEPDPLTSWVRDADGDGWGAIGGEEQSACKAPSGFVAEAGDCDDADVAVHPEALEACNELDDDCDGDLDEGFDEDADGHLSTACAAGDDCDDTDPGIYEGAIELCGDGRDNDCHDGDESCGLSGDYELSDSDAKIYATERNEDMARQIQVGDVDGDGSPDVFVASEFANNSKGGGHVLYGPLAGTMAAEKTGFAGYGSGGMSAAGRSIGIGDVNDDGYEDIEFGVPYSSGAFVEFGPVTADFDLADASVHYSGAGAPFFGHGSDLADVDGDDVDDVIVGAYQYDSGASHAGSVFIDFGPLTAGEILMVKDHDVELYGSTDSLWAGRIIHAGGDMDGDGFGDVVIQAFGYSAGAPGGGAVIVAHGPFPADIDLADADAWLVGDSPNSYAGWGLAQGDVDGDGLDDALVGAPYASSTGWYGMADGHAYVVSGPTVGTVNLADSDVVVHGTRGAYLGMALAAGDFDANGQPELVVGAPYDEDGAGATYLFYGAMPGSWDDTDAAARFLGESRGNESGSGLAVGDLDGNGRTDLLIGAPTESSGASSAGALYVWMSY